MPRPRKGPRLYLRAGRADRGPVYVILDGAREIGTGCGPERAGDAEAALAAYLAGKYAPPARADARLADILIADVITAYLREHAANLASAEFVAHTAAPILEWWGDKTLEAVRGATCREYVEWRTRQPVRNTARRRKDGTMPVPRMTSEATARHDLKTLGAAINHWHREHGPLPAVPTVTLPPPPPARERWLTRKEAAALLRTAMRTPQAGHIARFLLIGLYTGTRSKALLRLRWLPSTDGGWIDIEGGVIHRATSGARATKKRQPPARIPDRLLPHLTRWRKMDQTAAARKGRRSRPAAQSDGDGDERRAIIDVVHYAGRRVIKLRRSWSTVVAAAGLGRDVIPHTLRHTAATWLMQGGVDVYEAAGFLGMSAETLLAVYGHHHPDFQAQAAKADRGRRRARTDAEPQAARPRNAQETPGKDRKHTSRRGS